MYFLFYYLLTGENSTFVHKIYAAVPFNERNTSTLLGDFRRIVKTTMISSGAVALFQGAILTITFLIVKIQGAFLWGSIATLLSFVPVF
jgi:predicted PurR-regulated permease PerM